MGDLVEVDSFTIGGSKAGPSMPGPKLQAQLGSRILIDMHNHLLHVPTRQGWVLAQAGDRIVLWSDDSLEVQRGAYT